MGKARHLSVGSEHFSVRTKSIDAGHNRRIVGSNFRWARINEILGKTIVRFGKSENLASKPDIGKVGLIYFREDLSRKRGNFFVGSRRKGGRICHEISDV